MHFKPIQSKSFAYSGNVDAICLEGQTDEVSFVLMCCPMVGYYSHL